MIVDVNLDERTQKVLPVQAEWSGKLAPDVMLVRCTINPNQVELVGPKTILDSMSTIYTAGIPLNEIRRTGKTEVKVVIPSAFLALKPGSKDKVMVEYEVKERVDVHK